MINITIQYEDGKVIYEYKSDNWMKLISDDFNLPLYFEKFVKNDLQERYTKDKIKSIKIEIVDKEALMDQKGIIPIDFIFRTLRAEVEIERELLFYSH